MKWKMSFHDVLNHLQNNHEYKDNIIDWHTLEEREAKTVPFPADLHIDLAAGLKAKGINELYTHQAEAYDTADPATALPR